MTINKIPTLSDAENNHLLATIFLLMRESRRWQKEIKKQDITKVYGDVNSPYYCEAFGMVRTLEILGHGQLGPVNTETSHGIFNLRYWFEEIVRDIAYSTGYRSYSKRD